MIFHNITARITDALSIAPARDIIDPLFAQVRPEITEWSVNQDSDPRGMLRVALRPSDHARVRDALALLPHPFACSLYDAISDDIIEAYLGVALSAQVSSLRFWAAPLPSRCQAVVEMALLAEPALIKPVQLLADHCGGIAACEGLGVEGRAEHIARWTLYFPLPERAVAEYLIGHIDCGTSARRDFFFKALLGVGARQPRPFPRVWIGRSVGLSGGWKLYYFARHDPHRLPDRILLDMMDANFSVRETWRILGNYAIPAVRRAGLIHVIGLTIPDISRDAEPRLTVYFSLNSMDLVG